MRKPAILFTILVSFSLLFISNSPAYYLSDSLDNAPFLVMADEPDIIDSNIRQNRYVPDEIIVKYKEAVSGVIDAELSVGRNVSDLSLTTSLDKLHKKYRLRKSKALFENFRQRRQRAKGLLTKDKTLLSKKERRILKRLKRAPKGAKVPDLDRIYKLEVELEKGQSLEDVVAEYNNDPDVEYAELNYIVSTCAVPNDPYYPLQWALHNTGQMYPESGRYNSPPGTDDSDIDALEAWNVTTGSSDIIVAVVDTGVDYNHRDLQNNMWVNEAELNGTAGVDDDGNGYVDDIYGYDFINGDSNPIDDRGHGTHCSGIIAAEGNNGLDIAGVCWSARIMSLKFLDSYGNGDSSDAVVAFYYAVDNGADVTSNSWGGGDYSQSMQDAINYAYSQGVIMIAAAGNENNTSFHYPAFYDNMISVAATDSDDNRGSFSTYGDWVDIAAPGVDILSLRAAGTSTGTVYDDYTTIASGTSMACPQVAGAAALMLSLYPEIDVDDLEEYLLESTDSIDPEICVSGRLNANQAMMQIVTPHGRVVLDNEIYSCSGLIEIRLCDWDLVGQGTQQVAVEINGGDFETVLLTEIMFTVL